MMKKKILIFASIISIALASSCGDEFLQKEPLGVVSEKTLSNKEGVNALLVGAYSLLDGIGTSGVLPWATSSSNWSFGEVAADNAYKGADAGSETPATEIERYAWLPTNGYLNDKWRTVYDGVSRSNDVLMLLEEIDDMAEAEKTKIAAEARFLRGHYHFEAKKMWNNVPYVDEAVENYEIPNNKDIWPDIEADFQFAVDNLPETQALPGRATSWAAKAMLAKAHMFQQDYTAAKPLLDDIIDNGPFGLVDCFHDNFKIATKNNSEAIFEVQMSVNDGAPNGENGNYGDILNFPYTGGPGACCGIFQPSQNLVNAFRTDANGLPLLDTFNDEDVKNDQGVDSSEPFEPHTGNLDPRLDWTVGRRGIPYLDWGLHPGKDWIRDQSYAGPYTPIKNVYYKAEEKSLSTASGWAQGPNANTYRMIRLADVLLLRAEVAVEENDLPAALSFVNQVRARADNCVVTSEDGTPAANYVINEYPSFPSQDYARKAVHFERRLELALEGHRFFDLVRWNIAAPVLNKFIDEEKVKRTYLSGANFVKGVHEYYPIPQAQVDIMGPDILKQNSGY